MAIQKQDTLTSLEKTWINSIEYTLFIPSTVNVFRNLGKSTISLDNGALDSLRRNSIDNTLELLSNYFGGATVNADHYGVWFDGKNIVRERGTQITVLVPTDMPAIKFKNAADKEITLSVPEFFKLLAREIRDNFNQDSVLITARPIFTAFVS